VIDLHCHLLFGVDDGPADFGASLALARRARAEGIETIAATPHVDSKYQLAGEEIAALPQLRRELEARLLEEGVNLSVVGGAEVAMTRIGALTPEQLRALCLGGGDVLLVESPYSTTVPFVDQLMFDLQAAGLRPLLAHPERCPAFQRDPEQLSRLVQHGCLCSLSAGSLADDFGRTVRRFALSLLADGLVHDISTDAHDDRRRPPALRAPLEATAKDLPGLAEASDYFTSEAATAMLAGNPVPPPPPLTKRRRLFGR